MVTVIPEEAEVVRWIFQEYLQPGLHYEGLPEISTGERPRLLAVRSGEIRLFGQFFSDGSTPAPSSMANGTRGKYYSWRDGEIIPRRKSDKAVASDPIIHTDKFEAIIDNETFDKAQAKLADRKGNTAPKKARQYLLTGLVRCGDCGGIMGGVTQSQRPIYKCRIYHKSGAATCFCNTLPEEPLVSVVAKKLQDRYLSEPALARLRQKIEAKLAEEDRLPSRSELDRLQREIVSLDQKIDRGAERVLEVPDDLLPAIYGKLKEYRSERDRLQTELDAINSQKTRSDKPDVDQTIAVLRSLREALSKASPADTKRLLASIISRIDLHFTEGTGRRKRDFTHGTIHVRPNAGENGGTEPIPKDAQLSTKGSFGGTAPERHSSWGALGTSPTGNSPLPFSTESPSAMT